MQRLFLALMLAMAGILLAAEPGKHIVDAVNHKDRPAGDRELDVMRKPAEVLAFFGVEPGMNIVDIFAGNGYYTEMLARVAGPKGKVYLHNNAAWMSYVEKEVKARLEDNRLTNVERFDREFKDFDLPEGQADLITMVLVFHDLYYTAEGWPKVDVDAFLAQIYKGLKPGGTLAIVDHDARAGSGSESAQNLHRIDSEFARKVLVGAGFKFEGQSNILENEDDDHTLSVFDESMRRKSDRFIFKFSKPK